MNNYLNVEEYIDMSNPKCGTCGTVKTTSPKGKLYCKMCTKIYRNKNKKKINSYLEKYREKHRDDNVDYQKKYREENREELLRKKSVKWRLEHPEYREPSKYGKVSDHPEYAIWLHIKKRCSDHTDKNYPRYGGRGISVCERWFDSFDNFMDDMGSRPEPAYLYSIDRYPDKDGNYEPGNCRWATVLEQNNNRNARRTKAEVKAERESHQAEINRRAHAKEIHDKIPNQSSIYYPYNNLTTIKDFSEQTNIPLEICKYRYAQFPSNPDWIINGEHDNRFYEYKGHKYNMEELCILSGVKYKVMMTRVRTFRWDIERAVETP